MGSHETKLSHMTKYRATIPFMDLNWENQSVQYTAVKPDGPGITYFRGAVSETIWVDCLLKFDTELQLVGILNHFPVDAPPWEVAGNITMFVRPDRYRRGIATELMDEARRRWNVNLNQQEFTRDGAAFVNRYVARHDLTDGNSRVAGS